MKILYDQNLTYNTIQLQNFIFYLENMKKSQILRKYGKISDLESLFTFMQNQQFKKKTMHVRIKI